MIDRRLMERIEDVLAPLSARIQVTERDMAMPMLTMPDFSGTADGEILRADGMSHMPLSEPPVILSVRTEEPGGEDMLKLAAIVVRNLASRESFADNRYDVYRRALSGEATESELMNLGQQHQIPGEMNRAVMVFHMVDPDRKRAFDLLDSLIPLEDGDVLIDLDRNTAALIKATDGVEDETELAEYAEALQETLMSETAHMMTVGIGTQRLLFSQLKESYREARQAIEVGRIFEPDVTVHIYQRLVMQRLLLELPEHVSQYYHQLLFNDANAKLFNEEMLYTIDMFFRKDLNLSDTSRQLYIHRNTLVYRLDKVQRQTGLDLRHFDDAVTFKILMELKKCAEK